MFGSNDIKFVLKKMDELGFSSIQEFMVFLYIAENPNSIIKSMTNDTCVTLNYLKKILSGLKRKELIESDDDSTYTGNSKLKRQVYFLSQKGQKLYLQGFKAE